VDDSKLTLGDLFSAVGKTATDVINTNRLEKQLKSLRKEAQTTALTAPISGRKRLQIERDANYEQVKKQLNKWIP
jgi:U3 small nucleolar RNA-associated protein 14